MKFTKDLMIQWLAGNRNDCWENAVDTEINRRNNKKTKKTKPTANDSASTAESFDPTEGQRLTAEKLRMYKRTKELVNCGELSKAMSTILSNGIARVDDQVLSQLREKHPQRTEGVNFPTVEVVKIIKAECSLDPASAIADTNMETEMKAVQVDKTKDNNDRQPDSEESRAVLDQWPSLTVGEQDILTAAQQAKRLTSGGLQQITPWHLKRAFYENHSTDCAAVAARLATRWGNGDFSEALGELVAESKLVALYKNAQKQDVRPVSVGCSLRRLLTKAYCSGIRERIKAHVEGSQLGVLKAGYEIGVHAMRGLAKRANQNGWAILLLDFANAFNTVDRNIMLELAASYCPELVNLTYWLYKLEPRLVTTTGSTVKSSIGTQQGCSLSNPLFALVMEYISKKL